MELRACEPFALKMGAMGPSAAPVGESLGSINYGLGFRPVAKGLKDNMLLVADKR